MKVNIRLFAPVNVAVDTRTGEVLSVDVDDEGIEIGAGVNDTDDIEVSRLDGDGEVPSNLINKAIAIAERADWPAWHVGA